MRLLPRSLFGRLVLVLLAGLLLAQLLGAAIQFQDRGAVLYQASGLYTAERIGEIVRLLDSSDPEERVRLVGILDTPPMRVVLSQDPWPEPVWQTGRENLAAVFRAALRRDLGDGERRMRVAVSEAPLPIPGDTQWTHHGPGRGLGRGLGRRHRMAEMGMPPAEGLSFVAQIQLADGSWVGFDHRLPKEMFAWPWRLLATLGVLLAAVVVLSVLAVRWVTRPLSLLAGAAEGLGRDIHRPPLPESGPQEVRHAARAFNTMQTRLTRYVEDRTRMVSAISHDLRTPITRLRLRAELLEDPALRAALLKDLDEMQGMTSTALDFLRGLEEQEGVQPLDLTALLESLKADAEDLGREVDIQASSSTPYPARPLALKRCLANLMDNAIKYGGRARVTLDDDVEHVRIRIADDGPGIPEDELERVFEPFYRLEASRSRETGGSGLGLSIARNVARAHGGELALRNRPEGGLEAVLTLPRR
jgi:signal transduction histidine kinase